MGQSLVSWGGGGSGGDIWRGKEEKWEWEQEEEA